MLGAAFSSLGFGYLESYRGNTRVDPIYALLSRKYQLVIDIFFNTFLYLPGFVLLNYAFIRNARRLFVNGERFINTFWMPPMWPINVIISIGYILFLITYAIHVIMDIQEFIQLFSNKSVPRSERA
jgi:TRAP-type mannitol/chloroaromatic compound transport system permease small subunit